MLYTDRPTGFTVELDDATQFATIYHVDGRAAGTLQRARAYEDGPRWKLFAAPNGEYVTARYLSPRSYERLVSWAAEHLRMCQLGRLTMGIASTIKSGRMAGSAITSQAIADFASAAWRDYQSAVARGDVEAAKEHEAEFDALCELFQETGS